MSALLAQLPAANLLPILGARGLSTFGLSLECVAAGALGVAASRRSMLCFQLSQLLTGLGLACFTVSRQTTMRQLTPIHARGRATAFYGGSIRVACALCPWLGGWMANGEPSRAARVFYVQMVAAAAAALVVFCKSPTTTAPQQQPQQPKARKAAEGAAPAMWLTLLRSWRAFYQAGVPIFLLTVMRSAKYMILPLAGVELGMSQLAIGSSIALGTTLEAPMFLVAGWGYDRYGRKLVAVPSLSAMALSWVILGRLRSPSGLTIASALMGVANGLLSGINTLVAQDFAPGEGHGVKLDATHAPNFFGLWNIAMQLASIASPLLVGALSQRYSVAVASSSLGGLTALSALWFGLVTPETRPKRD